MGAAMIHKHFLASHAALNQMGAVIFYAYTFSLLRQSEEGRGFIQPPYSLILAPLPTMPTED